MPQVNGAVVITDPLDAADYDPIDHLNEIFSHPSSLTAASTVSFALKTYQNDLHSDINNLVSAQAASDVESIQGIQNARAELAALFKNVESVRECALRTEQTITGMTAEIQRLDATKKNLTLSMTALKRLQMLTTAYEQLQAFGKTRQYKDCAQLLQAVIQLMAHFKSYRSIDQIAALGKKVAELQNELLEQVCEDFESAFTKEEVPQRKATLAEGCLVLDALGESAKFRLITWYCNASLREYRQIFRGNDEAGSLDNISRRYAWFNRLLKAYDVQHAAIFPSHWRMNEMLANAFCSGTREDYKNILQRSIRRQDGQMLDVNLLLSCLQETLDFEHSLEKRFASESRPSTDTMNSSESRSHGFEQAISEAFEPYLSLWVEAQDKQLSTMIPKYKQQALRNTDEEFNAQLVVPSSTELFQFYRLTLAQCAKLSTGGRLLELTKTFAKYLDQYNQQVLFHFLGDKFGTSGPSVEDVITILNTADYCYMTCIQLEEKIKLRIDEDFKSQIDLQSQADAFMGTAGAGVRALIRKIEQECEPGWREMRNMPWGRLENVGDQSTYVAELIRPIKTTGPEILKLLHKQQYSRAFSDNLVDTMTSAYITNVAQCRPVSETGAEQMLLDTYALKASLTEFPTIGVDSETVNSKSQQAHAKRVAQATSKIDTLLKTLQVRPSPAEALVQAYLIHIADTSESNFKKILDLKGVTRKQEQAQLIELFNAHRASPSIASNLVANSPFLTALQIGAGSTQTASSASGSVVSGVSLTPNLSANKFDPASFGSAILNAARDGVDRFGPHSAIAGTAMGAATGFTSSVVPPSSTESSAAPSRVSSPPNQPQPQAQRDSQSSAATAAQPPPPSQQSNLNDNLRNIGKFFRRDMSGFGRFGKQTSMEDSK